jgi:hypothetical protein
MNIITVSETPIKKNVHQVDARMLYDKDSAQAVHIRLNQPRGKPKRYCALYL